MKKILIIILYSLLLIVLQTTEAEELSTSPQSKQISARQESVSQQLTGLSTDIKLQQQQLGFYKERIDLQDKRLDDQKSHFDHILNLLGILLTGLGIVLSLAGIAGYVSVQRKAQREAESAAKGWLHEHAIDLEGQINALQTKLHELEGKANNIVNAHIQNVQDTADKAQQLIQKRIYEEGKDGSSIPLEAANALAETAQVAKQKPEAEYTYKDWNNRAYASYSEGDKSSALRFWKEAAEHISASVINSATALFNTGIVLGELNRGEEEIAVYNEIVRRFGEATEVELREQVARALINKGIALRQQDRCEEAIAVYDKVVRRFGEATEVELRKLVARALLNKGIALGQKDRSEEAIAVYDEVVRRFGKVNHPGFRGGYLV